MGNNGGGNGYKPFVSDEWTLYPAVFGEDLTEEQENDLTLIDLLALEERIAAGASLKFLEGYHCRLRCC